MMLLDFLVIVSFANKVPSFSKSLAQNTGIFSWGETQLQLASDSCAEALMITLVLMQYWEKS